MLKIFKNKHFFKKLYKHDKNITTSSLYPLSKKRLLLLLIPQNKDDRVFIVLKTKMLSGYGGKGIKYFNN